MTTTPAPRPPASPGTRPTTDHRVTVFAACSVLCTVAALVCLGLLVFGDRQDADATAAGPPTSGSTSGTGDSGSDGSDDSGDGDAGSGLPDDLTDAGWSGGPECRGGDPWIYAAENSSEQVLLCFSQGLIYLGDEDSASIDVEGYQTIAGICPVTDAFQSTGRYVWYNMDIGWTEFNGATKYVRRLDLHETDPDKMYNLTATTYDNFWVNDGVSVSPLRTCANGPVESPYEELMAEDRGPSPTTSAGSGSSSGASGSGSSTSASSAHGGLDLGPNGDGAGAVSPTGKVIEECEYGLPAPWGKARYTDGTTGYDPVCQRIRDEFYAERPYLCGPSDATAPTPEDCSDPSTAELVYDTPDSLWARDPQAHPQPLTD